MRTQMSSDSIKMEEDSNAHPPAHVLIFPIPAQGHVNSMLKLAELLSLAGLHVTFLNTDYNQDRLFRHTNVQARFSGFPGFQFKIIPDGLPADHPRAGDHFREMLKSMNMVTKPLLREMLVSSKLQYDANSGRSTNNIRSGPVNCIIADGILTFPIDVGNELGIPVVHFRTIGACAFWVFFSVPDMDEAGELPNISSGEGDMDRMITRVPGMETFLRCRDLPKVNQLSSHQENSLKVLGELTKQSTRAHALILNTFEDLERPVLSHIRTQCPQIYTLGPLHALLKHKHGSKTTTLSEFSNSLFQEDKNCIKWLDAQPLKSVIYVSFGSIAKMTKYEMREFWYGLINSKKRFLWVIKPDMVDRKDDDDQIQVELVEGTKERGYMAEWVPQEDVLAHPAVGGFFTHSGWNSTIESIIAGVPMICWPHFVDQQVNSRFVSEVWKLGIDMKDVVCNRVVVEKMVKDLMEERREEFTKSTDRMARLAKESVSEGGYSYYNLERLIEDIRFISVGAKK